MKHIFWGIAGLALGAIAGSLIGIQMSKTKYARFAEEEINSVKEHYVKKTVDKKEGKVNVLPANSYEEAKKNYNLVAKEEELEGVDGDDEEPEFDPDEEIEDVPEIDSSKPTKDRPYLIDDDEFIEGRRNHDKVTLYYYAGDDVFADENEEVLDEINKTIGPDIGNKLEVVSTVYVRNERLGIDYEIVRHQGSYQEVVLGITPELSPRERQERRKNEG